MVAEDELALFVMDTAPRVGSHDLDAPPDAATEPDTGLGTGLQPEPPEQMARTGRAVDVAGQGPGTGSGRVDRIFIEPVRRLHDTLNDVLDVEGNPGRSPDEALARVRSAMDTFHEETEAWW